MTVHRAVCPLVLLCIAVFAMPLLRAANPAQSLVSSGMVQGTVVDPSGAVVPNAIVVLSAPVTNFRATATTDLDGRFVIRQIPFNQYHLSVTAAGFSPVSQDVYVRSTVPI